MNITELLYRVADGISPSLYYKLAYLHNHGRWPNLRHPHDIAEVIGHQCVNGEINQFSVYADKLAVRQYVEQWVGVDFLPELYGVWNTFDEVDFNSLPQRFALKTNHGCGGIVICRDKEKLDMAVAKQTIDKAMASEYGGSIETHYKLIPHKVYAEELLTDNEDLPADYKFHCWKGEIMSVLCCVERGKGSHVKLKNYDANWKPQHILKKHEVSFDIDCPPNFDEMKRVAKTIAQHFKQVRVDLYSYKGRSYVGELTFTPEGGLMTYYKRQGLLLLAGNTI